jgi:hypothetical protein
MPFQKFANVSRDRLLARVAPIRAATVGSGLLEIRDPTGPGANSRESCPGVVRVALLSTRTADMSSPPNGITG